MRNQGLEEEPFLVSSLLSSGSATSPGGILWVGDGEGQGENPALPQKLRGFNSSFWKAAWSWPWGICVYM